MPAKGRRTRMIWGSTETGDPGVGGLDVAHGDTPATFYSNALSLGIGSGTGHHMEWTATIAGTLTFWVSNKPNPNMASDADWVQVQDFTVSSPAGSPGKAFYHLGNMQADLVRWKLVTSAGAGQIRGWASSKDV